LAGGPKNNKKRQTAKEGCGRNAVHWGEEKGNPGQLINQAGKEVQTPEKRDLDGTLATEKALDSEEAPKNEKRKVGP